MYNRWVPDLMVHPPRAFPSFRHTLSESLAHVKWLSLNHMALPPKPKPHSSPSPWRCGPFPHCPCVVQPSNCGEQSQHCRNEVIIMVSLIPQLQSYSGPLIPDWLWMCSFPSLLVVPGGLGISALGERGVAEAVGHFRRFSAVAYVGLSGKSAMFLSRSSPASWLLLLLHTPAGGFPIHWCLSLNRLTSLLCPCFMKYCQLRCRYIFFIISSSL